MTGTAKAFIGSLVACVVTLVVIAVYEGKQPVSNPRSSNTATNKDPVNLSRATTVPKHGQPIVSPNLSGSTSSYMIQLKPMKEPIQYRVSRKERTIETIQPQYTTNIDLHFEVAVRGVSAWRYMFTFNNVDGKDIDNVQTKHLKRIGKTIETLQMVREFDSHGPVSEFQFLHSNPAGWAGMMVARALGREEYGFLDIDFPRERIGLGGTWITTNDLDKDSMFVPSPEHESGHDLYSSSKTIEKDGEAHYLLKSVKQEKDGFMGEITYRSSRVLDKSYESEMLGDSQWQERIVESGTIWVDLETGWPVRSSIVRRIEAEYKDGLIIDEYSTLIERI